MAGRGTPGLTVRVLATFGLAAAMLFVAVTPAAGAPADRPGDPVVLKGSDLAPLLGSAPGEIVGFAWSGGWRQIPVQVDERHRMDARRLYPPGNHRPYVGDESFAFEIEVYSDAATRAGPDPDPLFDADDEFVFMGEDAGGEAPAVAQPPAGVDGESAVRIVVDDPLGEGRAYAYLVRAAGGLDAGAGRDYVQYDFRLTGLGPGKTLRDDYGYFGTFNPEDSRVRTRTYELHSYDRWMEDELRVKAGGASGVDILDREVAQATRTSCGRTEYTFSGRWTEDSIPANDANTDTEGTYVTVRDGPVRAIRSYMGANSGPYVQREHIYYRDHEENTIFLRVHAMKDLYMWTDFAEAATGMTYRDLNNVAGVPVDGVQDVLVPTGSADVTNGAWAWQQLAGPQGAVSTVVAVDTNIPNPDLVNYYLDEAAPGGGTETQCGGDGKSIGASGFGIRGNTPNTDPRQTPFSSLAVKRVRYFGPPGDGAVEAARYRDRVRSPLQASASRSPITGEPDAPQDPDSPEARRRVNLRVALVRPAPRLRRGGPYRVRIRVANRGTLAGKPVRVCVRSAALRRKGACRVIRLLPARSFRNLAIGVRVRPNVRGRRIVLRVVASSPNGKSRAAKRLVVRLRR